MQTIEEIRKCGFHCNNFVQADKPCMYYNKETGDITSEPKTEEDGYTAYPIRTWRIFPKGSEKDIQRINDAKLVIWYQCLDNPQDIAKYLRCRILEYGAL